MPERTPVPVKRADSRRFLDLRIGGTRITVERVPAGLLMLLGALVGSGGVGWWFGR